MPLHLEPLWDQTPVLVPRYALPLAPLPHRNRLIGLQVPPAVAFLGRLYPPHSMDGSLSEPWSALNPIPVQYLEGMLLDPESHPDVLHYILGLSLPAARAIYLYCLHRRHRHGQEGLLSAAEYAGLFIETQFYGRKDAHFLRRRVYDKVTGYPDKDVHWNWSGHCRPGDRPGISFFGHTDVPVHRLLWAVDRASELLQPNQRLRRNDECPEGRFPRCVNPHHYEKSYPRTISMGYTPGRRSPYPRYRYEWGLNDMRQVTEFGQTQEIIFCPQGHRFGPGVQNSYWMQRNGPRPVESPRGQAICPQCREAYLFATGGKKVKRLSRAEQPGHYMSREESLQRDVNLAVEAVVKAGLHLGNVSDMPDEEDA